MPAESAAQLFNALGDPTRLALVGRLSQGGPAAIVSLTAGTDMTRQAVTKHLRVMEKAGLVRCTRLGRTTAWELDRRRLEDAQAHLAAISRQWDDALDRLRSFVED